MIGREYRFHGRGSIQRLYGRGKAVRAGALSLRYVPNRKLPAYRLAVVVSRKVSKSAVVRNRIRRRLYERVRILSGQFPAAYDLILVVYDAALATAPAAELDRELMKLLLKAKLVPAGPQQHAIVIPKEKS